MSVNPEKNERWVEKNTKTYIRRNTKLNERKNLQIQKPAAQNKLFVIYALNKGINYI